MFERYTTEAADAFAAAPSILADYAEGPFTAPRDTAASIDAMHALTAFVGSEEAWFSGVDDTVAGSGGHMTIEIID